MHCQVQVSVTDFSETQLNAYQDVTREILKSEELPKTVRGIPLKGFFEWLANAVDLKVSRPNISPQLNGYDCGTYALYYGICILQHRIPNRVMTDDVTPNEIRRMMGNWWYEETSLA